MYVRDEPKLLFLNLAFHFQFFDHGFESYTLKSTKIMLGLYNLRKEYREQQIKENYFLYFLRTKTRTAAGLIVDCGVSAALLEIK